MGSGLLFDVRVQMRNDVARVAVFGALDIGTAPTLSDHLTRVERGGPQTVMLDVRELGFVDSTGVIAILQAWKRAEESGRRLVVVGARPAARRLCKLTGTEFILDDPSAIGLLEAFVGDGHRTEVRAGS